jgi:hypothetical protein
MIRVIDTDRDIMTEIRSCVEDLLKTVFLRDKTDYDPINMEKRFRIGRWTFQQICAAAHFNFNDLLTYSLEVFRDPEGDITSPIGRRYKDIYVRLATETLATCFFSTTQQMFVQAAPPVKGGPPAPPIARFLSLDALTSLNRLIGQRGCYHIYRGLSEVAANLARGLIEGLVRILAGPRGVFDSGLLQSSDAGNLIRTLGHVSAVLKLRQMFRRFSGGRELLVAPDADNDLVNKMAGAGIQDIIDNVEVLNLFGAMLACSYWDTFTYDAVNDSVKDNSHLWAKFFDAFVGVALALGLNVTPELFYRGLFAQCIESIKKGKDTLQGRTAKRNVGYPGLQLIIW